MKARFQLLLFVATSAALTLTPIVALAAKGGSGTCC